MVRAPLAIDEFLGEGSGVGLRCFVKLVIYFIAKLEDLQNFSFFGIFSLVPEDALAGRSYMTR